jgi:polysaccharide export outer membrane protein
MKVPRKLSQNIFAIVCSLLATALLVTGCATSPDPFTSDAAIQPVAEPAGAPTTNNPAPPAGQGVRFQVGDLLIITFSDTSEGIPPHEERIKEDGNITLPLIGAIKAVGKSDGELQKEIRDSYVPKYYVRLAVGVRYVSAELSYTVLGEVRGPGPKPYSGKTTVTKAIGAAGGLTDFADKRKIVLTRANGTKLKVNYKKAIEDSKFDPQVFPGDSINVPKTWY